MKHLKFLQISGFMIALLSLTTPSTWAQSTVTLPAACQNCPGSGIAGTITAFNCSGVSVSPSTFDAATGAAYNGTAFIPYTGGNGGTYAAGSVASTGVTGFTATWAAGTFATGAGFIPITITGSSTTFGVASFPISIAGQSCNISIGSCGAFTGPGVFTEFLCHNLGADITLDPNVPVVGLQGAYIGWGSRGPNTTGDSRIDWQTAANDGPNGFAAAPTAADPNAGTISGWTGGWFTGGVSEQNWGVTRLPNDPCPVGYRVPMAQEWQAVIANNTVSRTGTFVAGNTQYGSALHFGPNASTKTLTLPAAGTRAGSTTGSLANRGFLGSYWSSTSAGSNSYRSLDIYSSASGLAVGQYVYREGLSLRCIKE